jgi:hypothetical protein
MAKAEVFSGVNYPDKLNKRESKVVETAKSGCLNFARSSLSYSDLVDGSAVEFGDAIPSGAIVQRVYLDVKEAFTLVDPADLGDGIEISIELDSAEDIQASTDVLGAPFSTTGLKESSIDGSLASYVSLSADKKVKATMTVNNLDPTVDEALASGKVDVIVEYVVI